MRIEDQVCSLENAKRLKELGVKRESYFLHCKPFICIRSYVKERWAFGLDHSGHDVYPAYTVAELGEMLPNEIDDGTGNYFIFQSGQLRGYRDVTGRWLLELQGTRKETDARAMMLIWLLENNYITTEEVNK